ncbi:MAG: hypothetical protein ABIH00_08350 [Armatimonadota bacterium]
MDKKDFNKVFWLSLGFGLVIGGVVFTSLYFSEHIRSKDPRVKKVEDLISEAEKLISISKSEKEQS